MKKILQLVFLIPVFAISQPSLDNINLNTTFRHVDWRWVLGSINPGSDSVGIYAENLISKVVKDTAIAMQSRGLDITTAWGKQIPVNGVPAAYLIMVYARFAHCPRAISVQIGDNIDVQLDAISNGPFLYHRGVIDTRVTDATNDILRISKNKILD